MWREEEVVEKEGDDDEEELAIAIDWTRLDCNRVTESFCLQGKRMRRWREEEEEDDDEEIAIAIDWVAIDWLELD